MIVVSNTSPITNLAAIGQLDLLRRLYGSIHIAEAVNNELHANGKAWPGAVEVSSADWIICHQVADSSLIRILRRDLDAGESESIALSLELHADLLLLDEKDGRHIAQQAEINVVGVVGILLEAKAKGYLVTIQPHLDALREKAGFYLNNRVYQAALRLADEFSIEQDEIPLRTRRNHPERSCCIRRSCRNSKNISKSKATASASARLIYRRNGRRSKRRCCR